MKKITITIFALLIGLFVFGQASTNSLDVGPKGTTTISSKGAWTSQFVHNINDVASAGIETDGSFYYITQWNSSLIWKYNMTGVKVDSFSVVGLTGLRDSAYDGTYFYGGASGNSIYQMDFSTTPPSLVSTISSPSQTVRHISYDPTADGGAGGFWVGNWATDFSLVSRSGTQLSSISAASHGLQSTYGSAFDNITSGGPYIWTLSAGDPVNATIIQISVATGQQTGVSHDVSNEVPGATTGGGLFIQPNIIANTNTLGGLIQGTAIFGYDLASTPLDSFDIAMTSLTFPTMAITGQSTDITGVITNNGSVTITSYDLSYKIDSDPVVTESITGASIASNQTFNFTHGTPYLTTSGNHTIEVWVSNPNGEVDANPANDLLSTTLLAANEIYPRNVVYEEGTGTWCGWCVRGLVGLNTMAHDVTDGTWIGIGVHNGDPMVVSAYDNAIGNFISGYPSGIMNRNPTPVDPGLTTLQAAYNTHKAIPSIAKIEVTNKTYDASSRAWTIDVASTFGMDLTSADYNTALIIVENEVTGTSSGFNQANYYSGGSRGDMIDYDGRNYANLADPVPAADMVYNHVGRKLVDGFDGSANSIPSTITYNTPNNFSYSGTLSANYRDWKVSFVAIIIDNTTGQIVNATEVLLGSVGVNNATDSKYSIYPNPTNGLVTVEGAKDAKIIVYNMIGEVIYSNDNSNENTTIDLSSFSAGNYIVKIIDNNEVSTQKIVLTK